MAVASSGAFMAHGSAEAGRWLLPPTTDSEVTKVAKMLIIIGLVLVVLGLAWLVGERLGLGRLPGDIVIEREGTRIYIPLATSLIVSILLSLVLWFFGR